MRLEVITPEILQVILRWWEDRGDGSMPAELLPPFGVVAIDDEGPAAAAWLSEVRGCPVGNIDWLVGRPGMSPTTARSACRAVFAALEAEAARIGIKMLFACAYRHSIYREAARCGFTEISRGVINMAKPLAYVAPSHPGVLPR
ncbi:MAG: hypothetical protein JWO82_1472 [Akkermansiaceae bacterium]|nr:hypothetical protein [Akkermansiaceae bacterium]